MGQPPWPLPWPHVSSREAERLVFGEMPRSGLGPSLCCSRLLLPFLSTLPSFSQPGSPLLSCLCTGPTRMAPLSPLSHSRGERTRHSLNLPIRTCPLPWTILLLLRGLLPPGPTVPSCLSCPPVFPNHSYPFFQEALWFKSVSCWWFFLFLWHLPLMQASSS